jgi:2-polyprenyl-3-methyl-5-hydroxy-6-metoxy-1,4-benzoquinol methylase
MAQTDDPMREVKQAAVAFRDRVADIRSRVMLPNGLQWYPHVAPVQNFFLFDQLLKGPDRRLFADLPGKTVADIGGADGDMAFLLETLGASVDLIDHPTTSNNALQGAKTLKRELGSSVQIHEIDVDSQFVLPRRYDLVLLLGILYHLKNPYYALEHLARNTGHLLLSTRIAEFTAPIGDPRRVSMSGPLAYLLDAEEMSNKDSTCYWIFSEASLRRLFARTGWEVAGLQVHGDDVKLSDPFTREGDRRAFCYLRSKIFTPQRA